MKYKLLKSNTYLNLQAPRHYQHWVVKSSFAFFGSLILVCASKMQIPLGIVKISLQSTSIILLTFFLGKQLGFLSVMVYLVEGLMGLPVFQSSPERGVGLAYLMGPTSGYLVGFLFATLLMPRLFSLISSFKKCPEFLIFLCIALITDLIFIQVPGTCVLMVHFGFKKALYIASTLLGTTFLKGLIAAAIMSLFQKKSKIELQGISRCLRK